MTQPVFETTASAAGEEQATAALPAFRHVLLPDLPVATVALIWPGFGVNWFGAGGNPNDDLAALSFSHQRLPYELAQIVPLAVIILIGVLFYVLGGKTRRETAAEPVAPAYVSADSPGKAS